MEGRTENIFDALIQLSRESRRTRINDFAPLPPQEEGKPWLANRPLNSCIQHLGLDLLSDYFAQLAGPASGEDEVVIVSVGSGGGSVERYLEYRCLGGRRRVICVDSDPGSFQPPSSFDRAPDHATCRDALRERPDLETRCHLFLNWASVCDPCYDLEAIALLRPKRVLLAVETTGSGGSQSLLAWLRSLPDMQRMRRAHEFSHVEPDEVVNSSVSVTDAYGIVRSDSRTMDFGGFTGTCVYRYVLLERGGDTH